MIHAALQQVVTQQAFGDIVGLSQKSVSDLIARGVIRPGESAASWLLGYTSHLREQAAGRGADGKLADARTKVAQEQCIKLERENRKAAGELVPVELLELVLSTVGRTIAGVLEPLHVNLRRRCPELTSEALKLIQLEVSKACDLAVNASLAVVDVDPEEASDTPEEEEVPHEDGI